MVLNQESSFRTKKACLIFFDEIDAVGGARFDDGAGGDNEVLDEITVNRPNLILADFNLKPITP